MLTAGMEMLRESSYADLTVRAVAARAKVASATAYTYFSSKNHLIAEVYLDLVGQVPYFTDVNDSRSVRVEKALRALTLMIADEPEVAAACTTALLSNGDAAVRTVRDRIGAEIHRRIRSAVGPDADPRTISALEMTYFGALVHAGSGAVTSTIPSPDGCGKLMRLACRCSLFAIHSGRSQSPSYFSSPRMGWPIMAMWARS